ncbi:MAG: hypothetical protein WDN30_07890 [Pararobbsia sp.]
MLLVVPGCAMQPAGPISPVVHVETVEAKVQVPVSCIDEIPVRPDFLSDAELLSEPNGAAVDRVWRDHVQRQKWEGELMGVLAACVLHPPPD